MSKNPPKLCRPNLPLLLLQAREAIFSHFRPILNAAGLTEQQWRIIRALLDNGSLEPRQIGDICCLSSPSLAGILARMDDMKLVQRDKLGHDQRRVLVSLTDNSEKLARELMPTIEATYTALEKQIGSSLNQNLHAILGELIKTLKDD